MRRVLYCRDNPLIHLRPKTYTADPETGRLRVKGNGYMVEQEVDHTFYLEKKLSIKTVGEACILLP